VYPLAVLKTLEKKSASTVGLLQALCITIYCGLIAIFFNVLSVTNFLLHIVVVQLFAPLVAGIGTIRIPAFTH